MENNSTFDSKVLYWSVPTFRMMHNINTSSIYSNRTTNSDIICTTNTAFEFEFKNSTKKGNLLANLPYFKASKTLLLSPKESTPFQKLRIIEVKVKKNQQLLNERISYFKTIHGERQEKLLLEHFSATRIQAIFRGYRVRPKPLYIPNKISPEFNLSNLTNQLLSLAAKLSLKPILGLSLETKAKSSKRRIRIENAAAFRIQRFFRMFVQKIRAKWKMQMIRQQRQKKAANRIERFMQQLAVMKVSKMFRGGKQKKAATVIQCCVRIFLAYHRVRNLKKLKILIQRQNDAAIIIQRAILSILRNKKRDTLKNPINAPSPVANKEFEIIDVNETLTPFRPKAPQESETDKINDEYSDDDYQNDEYEPEGDSRGSSRPISAFTETYHQSHDRPNNNNNEVSIQIQQYSQIEELDPKCEDVGGEYDDDFDASRELQSQLKHQDLMANNEDYKIDNISAFNIAIKEMVTQIIDQVILNQQQISNDMKYPIIQTYHKENNEIFGEDPSNQNSIEKIQLNSNDLAISTMNQIISIASHSVESCTNSSSKPSESLKPLFIPQLENLSSYRSRLDSADSNFLQSGMTSDEGELAASCYNQILDDLNQHMKDPAPEGGPNSHHECSIFVFSAIEVWTRIANFKRKIGEFLEATSLLNKAIDLLKRIEPICAVSSLKEIQLELQLSCHLSKGKIFRDLGQLDQAFGALQELRSSLSYPTFSEYWKSSNFPRQVTTKIYLFYLSIASTLGPPTRDVEASGAFSFAAFIPQHSSLPSTSPVDCPQLPFLQTRIHVYLTSIHLRQWELDKASLFLEAAKKHFQQECATSSMKAPLIQSQLIFTEAKLDIQRGRLLLGSRNLSRSIETSKSYFSFQELKNSVEQHSFPTLPYFVPLILELSNLVFIMGRPQEANQILSTATRIATSLGLSSTHPFHCRLREVLSLHFESICDFPRAVRLTNELIDLRVSHHHLLESLKPSTQNSPESFDIIYLRLRLAWLRLLGGDPAGKEIVACHSQEILSVLPQHHYFAIESNYLLGNSLSLTGHMGDANIHLQACLRLAQETSLSVLEPNHYLLCTYYFSTVENFRLAGYHREGVEIVNAYLQLAVDLFGERSLRVSLALYCRALLERDVNRFQEAEELFRQAISLLIQNGLDNTGIHSLILGDLSECVRRKSLRSSENPTEEALKRAIQARERSFGPQHFFVSDLRLSLALFLSDSSHFASGFELIRDSVIPSYEATLGPDNPRTLFAKANLSVCQILSKSSAKRHSLGEEDETQTDGSSSVASSTTFPIHSTQISEILHIFSNYKLLPFTESHPWVVRLGGYDDQFELST